MLAVVALVPLVALVAVVALVALVTFLPRDTRVPVLAVLSVQSRCAIPAVLPRRSVLSPAEEGRGGAVVHPRPIDELLGIDGYGRTLFTSRQRVLRV